MVMKISFTVKLVAFSVLLGMALVWLALSLWAFGLNNTNHYNGKTEHVYLLRLI